MTQDQNPLDRDYKALIARVLAEGVPKENTVTTTGAMLRHEMSDGFPLVTTKFVPMKVLATELEFFLRGGRDKKWLQERGCKIWDEWCNPQKVPKSLWKDEEKRKEFQKSENDLGEIYGYQWRQFDRPTSRLKHFIRRHILRDYFADQVDNVLKNLKKHPESRRHLVSAWNPNRIGHMGLPPCTFAWQTLVRGDRIDLVWYQRSADVFLGLPFDIASFGVLLKLLAAETGLKEGRLVGFIADLHVYANHIEQAKTLLDLPSYPLPALALGEGYDRIRTFRADKLVLENYLHGPKIKAGISVNPPTLKF